MLTSKIEKYFIELLSPNKSELTVMKRNLLLANPALFLNELKETKNCQLLDPKILSQGFGTLSSFRFLTFTTSATCYFMVLASVIANRRANSYTVSQGLRNFSRNIHYVLFGSSLAYFVKVKNHYEQIDSVVDKADMTEEECLSLLEKAYSGQFSKVKNEIRRVKLFNQKKDELKKAVNILNKRIRKIAGKDEIEQGMEDIVKSRNFQAAFDVI